MVDLHYDATETAWVKLFYSYEKIIEEYSLVMGNKNLA